MKQYTLPSNTALIHPDVEHNLSIFAQEVLPHRFPSPDTCDQDFLPINPYFSYQFLGLEIYMIKILGFNQNIMSIKCYLTLLPVKEGENFENFLIFLIL